MAALKKHRFSILACARWETEAIMEWIAWHLHIGFDHIYLCCNDDDPRQLFERVAPLSAGTAPLVSFDYYPHPGMQGRMYKRMLARASAESEWLCFLDVDEFVALKNAACIGEFVRPYEFSCEVLYLNWTMFGPNGFRERPQGSVLLQYTRRQHGVHEYTKMLFKPAAIDVPKLIEEGETGFWHRLEPRFGRGVLRQINVLGDDMTHYYDDFPRNGRAYLDLPNRESRLLQTAVINHYAFRSEADLQRRIDRGTGGDFGGQAVFRNVVESGRLEDFLRTFNEVEDLLLCDRWRAAIEAAWCGNRPMPRGPNLALGRPALQSSVSPWSREPTPERDAAGVVSGVFSGWYNCHTDVEEAPWWQVDLGEVRAIGKVSIWNRSGPPSIMVRTSRFRLLLSDDGRGWRVAMTKDDDTPVGGLDEGPFTWAAPPGTAARFVRVQLLRRECLHLDQVEIYAPD